MRTLARRLKRLEARVGEDDMSKWSDEKLDFEIARLGFEIACLVRRVSTARLKELMESEMPAGEHQALSDRERLALAIARGEEETSGLLSKIRNDEEDCFEEAYAEWQRIRAERRSAGAPSWAGP